MEEYERKNKNTKELQDLDPLGSPHLEERWSGGNLDLDLHSLSLKKMQDSLEEWRGVKTFECQEEKACLKSLGAMGKKTPFYGPP